MTENNDQQLSRRALVALVVGSMVGAGIFTLPAAFAQSTVVRGALISWAIAGTGMLMLAFVFQTLSHRKPDIDAGIYGYAKAGFGNYPGFLAAFGYWIACCLADVACLVLIKATLGQFFPVFGDGSTGVAIAAASVIVWTVCEHAPNYDPFAKHRKQLFLMPFRPGGGGHSSSETRPPKIQLFCHQSSKLSDLLVGSSFGAFLRRWSRPTAIFRT